VEKLTKKVCGIYMNRNWFDNYITADVKANRPLWLAHYDTAEISNPVTNQVAHQFTSTGKVVGYGGNLDLNAVKDSFFTPTKISPPIAPESPPESPQPITPPEPEKPVEPPTDGSQTLLDVIKQFISKLIDWIASLKRG
jgi:hypothetical protein